MRWKSRDYRGIRIDSTTSNNLKWLSIEKSLNTEKSKTCWVCRVNLVPPTHLHQTSKVLMRPHYGFYRRIIHSKIWKEQGELFTQLKLVMLATVLFMVVSRRAVRPVCKMWPWV